MISALITDECSHWIARISQLDGEPGDVGLMILVVLIVMMLMLIVLM